MSMPAHRLHGRLNFQGLDISVENAKGSVRKWYDHSGKEAGRTVMHHHYGYIKKTRGTDGDHVDVYVGPNPDADTAYIVNQMKKPQGSTRGDGLKWDGFDEQKVMLGFDSAEDAKTAYMKQYDDPRFFGGMKPMAMTEFIAKVLDPDNRGKKVAEHNGHGESSMGRRLRKLRERRSDPYAKTARVTGVHGYLTPEEITALQAKNRPETGIRGPQHAARFRSLVTPKIAGLSHSQEAGAGVPKSELRRGTEVELEHTRNAGTARQIAIDHLRESPEYYKELDAMEDRLKKTAAVVNDFVEDSMVSLEDTGYLAGIKLGSVLGSDPGVEELPPMTAFAKATTTKADAADAESKLADAVSKLSAGTAWITEHAIQGAMRRGKDVSNPQRKALAAAARDYSRAKTVSTSAASTSGARAKLRSALAPLKQRAQAGEQASAASRGHSAHSHRGTNYSRGGRDTDPWKEWEARDAARHKEWEAGRAAREQERAAERQEYEAGRAARERARAARHATINKEINNEGRADVTARLGGVAGVTSVVLGSAARQEAKRKADRARAKATSTMSKAAAAKELGPKHDPGRAARTALGVGGWGLFGGGLGYGVGRVGKRGKATLIGGALGVGGGGLHEALTRHAIDAHERRRAKHQAKVSSFENYDPTQASQALFTGALIGGLIGRVSGELTGKVLDRDSLQSRVYGARGGAFVGGASGLVSGKLKLVSALQDLAEGGRRGGTAGAVHGALRGATRYAPEILGGAGGALLARHKTSELSDRIDDVGIGILAAPYAADVVSKALMRGGKNQKVRAAATAIKATMGSKSRFGKSHGRELTGLALVAPGVTHGLAHGVENMKSKTAKLEAFASRYFPDFEYMTETEKTAFISSLLRSGATRRLMGAAAEGVETGVKKPGFLGGVMKSPATRRMERAAVAHPPVPVVPPVPSAVPGAVAKKPLLSTKSKVMMGGAAVLGAGLYGGKKLIDVGTHMMGQQPEPMSTSTPGPGRLF